MYWFGSTLLALVIGAAMIINLVVAGLSGIGLPAVLDRFGVDPALASGTFVSTVTDVDADQWFMMRMDHGFGGRFVIRRGCSAAPDGGEY